MLPSLPAPGPPGIARIFKFFVPAARRRFLVFGTINATMTFIVLRRHFNVGRDPFFPLFRSEISALGWWGEEVINPNRGNS